MEKCANFNRARESKNRPKNMTSLKRQISAALLIVILFCCKYAYSQTTAKIENIWQTHDVFQDNERGMNIHIKFSFTDMLNKSGACVAYFYWKTDDSMLIDNNQRYRAANGHVSTGNQFTPNITNGIYNDFVLFIPYAELHLPAGQHDIKFNVIIFDNNAKVIAKSDFQEFKINWGQPAHTQPSQSSSQQTSQTQTFSQSSSQQTTQTQMQSQNTRHSQQVYIGYGIGLDYGGLGGKIEYLPVKNFGLFGGLGYNFSSVGMNGGITYKIMPDKNVSPNLMLFYGYNGVTKVKGAPEYNMTSYNVTIGCNLDIKKSTGTKLSVGLFVPIRSQKFMDNYDAIKNDSRIELKNELWPILFSVGYNFLLN